MTPGIILSAGASSRMGRPKALLPTGVPGECFLTRLVRTLRAAGAADVVVVVRPGQAAIHDLLEAERLPPRTVENPEPDRGQLSSLIVGLNAVDRPGVRAVLVAVIDAPLVSVDTVRCLLRAHRGGAGRIVRPAAGDRHGHPVLFDRSLFDALRHADPDRGAKSVLDRYRAEIADVSVDDAGAFADIDTPADYARYIK